MYPLNGNWNPEPRDSRRVALPVLDADERLSPTPSIPAIATFQLKQRDSLDFTLDAAAWLGANGNPVLTSAVWAVASNSPKTPTIVAQAFSAQGVTVAVIAPASNPLPGDAYWLDVTLSIGATTPTNPNDVAIPARTIVRRIYIIVAAG